jgi:hypothetical protein
MLMAVQSAGEWMARIRFIIDGRSGVLVAPLGARLDDAESVVLFVPEESDRSLQVHLSASVIDDWRGSEACDRWLAYHGRAEGGDWHALEPLGYRLGLGRQHVAGGASVVLDADEVKLVNPLHAAEGRLCKIANADRVALGRVAARETGETSPGALCVGVDARGIDIRVPLGILRLDFGIEVHSEAGAEQAIAGVLKG